MLKRLLVTLGILAGLLSPVHAAGTIPFSLSQQLDQYGKPLAGCLFYSIQAGTTSTPQNAYQDSALTIPLPNPQVCDAAGRLPQMFFADGTIKVRLTDKNGVTQIVADNIQVVGASSGSGGGGTVDPTTILQTGDFKFTYGTGTQSGFVRANGRTIGSATSGATERANSDTQSLFEYLWGADANLTVSGGRGASAAADWAANKTITLPDLRSRTFAGLDDMGNSPAGRLTSTYFGGDATVLGAVGQSKENSTLVTANLPPYTPSGTVTGVSVTSTFDIQINQSGVDHGAPTAGPNDYARYSPGRVTSTGTGSFNGSAQGGTSTPVRTVQPTLLGTIYIKL
jgi:hypothetical protein